MQAVLPVILFAELALRVGQHVPLPHPATGRVDHSARVVKRFVDDDSGVPVAIVRYHGGVLRPVAQARIAMIGQSRAFKLAILQKLDHQAKNAILQAFGVTVSARAISHPESRFLDRLHRKGVPARFETMAAYREGEQVFFNRDFAAFVPSYRIHEYLHAAASPKWVVPGFNRLDEGVTEWLTGRACHDAGLRFAVVDDYAAPVEFARELESLVGRGVLEQAYFIDGIGALEAAVDAKLGPGTFAHAARKLESMDSAAPLGQASGPAPRR